MQGPLVSIIIPCFNAEQFVGEAIESALNQTYPNTEVVVVDDGSTDLSLRVIEGFGERVRRATGPNRGGSAARNRGLEMARGELIQFLDADDLLCPEKLSRQLDAGPPHPGFVVTSDRFEQPAGGTARRTVRVQGHADPFLFFLENPQLQTSAPLTHRSDLERVGGFTVGLACCQEFDLHLRLGASVERVLHIHRPLFTVRKQPGSVSANVTPVMLTKATLLEEAAERLRAADELSYHRRTCVAAWLARTARSLAKLGCHADAARTFDVAIDLHSKAAYAALPGVHAAAARCIGFRQASWLMAALHTNPKGAA